MSPSAVYNTNLSGLSPPRRGKVRDIYDLGDELLIVATDRISCFDVVLPTAISGKGEILTQLSHFWFGRLKGIVAHHLSSRPLADIIQNDEERRMLEKRTMLVKKAKPLPVEAIVRGYVSGSGWKEYRRQETICGIALPAGLLESAKLSQPIFTPSTKADAGHDENIPFRAMIDLVGREIAEKVRELSLDIYSASASYAESRGIIIADTKFEFGLIGSELILIDEVLTPDSSRFWPHETYAAGRAQASFDKQFVRDYLLSIGWNKQPPAPALPPDIVERTQQKYREALEKLTGSSL